MIRFHSFFHASKIPLTNLIDRSSCRTERSLEAPAFRRSIEMDLKSSALRLAEDGFPVFPVRPGDKRPLISGWKEAATMDPAIIAAWWSQWPDANIGIVTGERSGLVVLDVDVATGGLESFEELKSCISDWPDTLMVRTGSGGLHVYFRMWDGIRIGNSVSKLAPGLDIRGEGGFVVAPPSLHASGNRYEWINEVG
jgi:hypothetical protein